MNFDCEGSISRQWETTPVKTLSKRKRLLYVFQGYKYYKKRETLVHTKWSCFLKSCVGFLKIRIEDGNIFERKDHNHESMTLSELRLLFFRESVLSDSIGTRKTANDIICSASTILDDAEIQQIPKIESLKRSIRRQQYMLNDYNFSYNYDIPYELLINRSGNKFVQYDNRLIDGRIIAMWSIKNLDDAKLSSTYAVDGTFYTCPKPFYQLFVIYYIKDCKFVPFCYFVLPDKKQSTYEIAFSILKSSGGLISMDNVILDFELSIENAIMASFPKSKCRFCVFHYSQAVYRKIKSLGLENMYRSDKNFKFSIKVLLCFVFTKDEYRKQVFTDLAKSILNSYEDEKVKNLLNYYYKNWYLSNFFRNDDLYTRILFDIPFTNNGAEGFNSSLKREISHAHPSIVELLKCLRDRDHINEMSLYKTNIVTKKQSTSLDKKKKIKSLLQEMKNGNHCNILKRICGLYNFKDFIMK